MDTIKRKKVIEEEVQYTTRWEVAKEVGAGILLIATIVGAWLLIVMLFQAILKHNEPDSEEEGIRLESDIISLVR